MTIVQHMPANEYHAFQALNKSLLMEMNVSPLQFHWRMSHPDASVSGAMELGNLIHAAILEPGRLDRDCVDAPINDETGKPFGSETKTFKAVRADNPGKLIVSRDDRDAIRSALAAVRAHPIARRALFQPDRGTELSVFAFDPAVKVFDGRVKCRPDVWSPNLGLMVDVKTVRPMPLGMLPKYAWGLGYFHQAAWYSRVWKLETSESPAGWFWVLVDNEPPFDVSVCEIDAAYLEAAGTQIDLWLERIARCVESGRWPGKTNGEIHTLHGPSWALEVIGNQEESESQLVG